LNTKGHNNYIDLISSPWKSPGPNAEKVISKNISAEPTENPEISEQVIHLNEPIKACKDLEAIKTKVKQGFYNSDVILSIVADAILKEIEGT
jgi:hypothetical protein